MKRRQWMAVAGLAVGFASRGLHAKTVSPPHHAIRVEAVQYPAWVMTNGRLRAVRLSDVIGETDGLKTGAGAGMLLKLPEQSVVRLGESTQLEVKQFSFKETAGTTMLQSAFQVVTGVFRMTTAGIAKLTGTRNVKVELRTATIGIRGTDFWCMSDEQHDATCLFEGAIQLDTAEQGQLLLEQPTAFWARFFSQPVRPVGQATGAELAKFLRSTEITPGAGVAVTGGRWSVIVADGQSIRSAHALSRKLQEEGYPADLGVGSANGAYEVHIDHLASREDALAVLERLSPYRAGNARVALKK